MNRRSFLAKLVAGIAALPVIGKLCKRPVDEPALNFDNKYGRGEAVFCRGGIIKTRPGSRALFQIPPEAGKVLDLNITQDGVMVLLMEHGVWFSNKPYTSCRKLEV